MIESFAFVAYLILFVLTSVLVFLVERKFRFSDREQIFRVSLYLFSALVLFLMGLWFSQYGKTWISRETFKNLSLFLSSIYLVNAVFSLNPNPSIWRYVVYFLFFAAFVTSELFLYPVLEVDNYYSLIVVLQKLFVILGVVSLFYELGYAFSSCRIRRLFRATLIAISLAVLVFWEFNIVSFDISVISGVILLVFVTALYLFLISRGIETLERLLKSKFYGEDLSVILFNFRILITLVYIYVIVKSITFVFPVSRFLTEIFKVHLIDSELVKVSVWNVLLALYLAIFLFSLLNLAKKFVKLTFPPSRREVEGGSAEALIFNIGVLFNVVILLSALGLTWKVLLPIAGTLGVGIGFGLQTIMNNYVSGFILLFSKKLKVGDIVELPSVSVSTLGSTSPSVFGKIENIGILSTIVRTNHGVEISIPNSNFISSPIVNFSYKDPYVRLTIPVGVAYSSDPEVVKRILLSVVDDMAEVLNEPPPDVWFEELGDSALIFSVLVWIDIRKHLGIKNIVSRFYFKVWDEFKRAGVEIPFPQNDIWFRNSLKVEFERGGRVDKGNP